MISRDAATQPPLSSSIHVLSVQLNAPSCVDFHEDGALPHTRLLPSTFSSFTAVFQSTFVKNGRNSHAGYRLWSCQRPSR